MKIPKPLQPLIDDGIVEAVVRQLKSGKEASVFLVRSNGQLRCAKVYKDATQRGFQQLAEYQEGRKARGSRDARAMGKGSKHGRREQEAAWKNAEVDALYRLVAAGVRVPKPQGYYEGVLVMEVVTDADGQPAPRLNDVHPDADLARDWHTLLIRQVRVTGATVIKAQQIESLFEPLISSTARPIPVSFAKLQEVLSAATNL